MKNRRGFSTVEMIVVIAIAVLLVALLLPALAPRRRGTCSMGSTQVRGIHSGMVLYAQGNNTWYPGLDNSGKIIDVRVEHRLEVMLAQNYFTGEYMISPAETKTTWTSGSVSSANYSYAMLDVHKPGGRFLEWRDTVNTEGAVISDRNIGSDAAANISSIHTASARGDWRGSVAWNDNHVSWETDATLTSTLYGVLDAANQPTQRAANFQDNLFQAAGMDDALMIHSGNGE